MALGFRISQSLRNGAHKGLLCPPVFLVGTASERTAQWPVPAVSPKGASIKNYQDEEILLFADKLNEWPRRKLAYPTPEELFEAFLDGVYDD